ncbi:MAG: hypothetical protein CVU57_17630 [Deltaproteobacteria bacterium HGW-Deltaproteobacteria-15]|nr:MAG: hypothetical protein CVU57_17630 [Deltaproteobacteria bacterium HGW-Deltaproteobacteria-15]
MITEGVRFIYGKIISPPAALEARSSQRMFVFGLQAARPAGLRGRRLQAKRKPIQASRQLTHISKSSVLFICRHLPAQTTGCATGNEKIVNSAPSASLR